ncbi:MAG: hypothetical protein NZ899_07175 [Thermoguttaceae bacterium]|nr:hypothetical protein [Thermoguttaceae bacterium]MDW8079665.1 hypothetical protein [Thermoguttaceae bacterium]
MVLLVEDPLPILFVGVLAEALLGLALLHTGRMYIVPGMIAVAILTGGAIIAEALIVTDREAIEAQLERGAAAFVQRDWATIDALIAPDAQTTRSRASFVLEHLKFHWIKIRQLEITVNRLTSPPTAEAKFRVAFRFEETTGQYPYRYDEVGLLVELMLTNQGWLVTDHIEAYEIR